MEARRQQRGPPRGQAQNQREESGSVANQNTESMARTYAICGLPSSESTRVIEGENFKYEILLRGRGYENLEILLIYLV